MEFCPKCGHRLLQERDEVKNGYVLMLCPICQYKKRKLPKDLEQVERAKPAPLPDMPRSSKRYYPGYMSPREYFRDEKRQMDMVESITKRTLADRERENILEHSRAEEESNTFENLSLLLRRLERMTEDLKQTIKTLRGIFVARR